MSDDGPRCSTASLERALRPMWLLTSAAVVAAAATTTVENPGNPLLGWFLLAAGLAALWAALCQGRSAHAMLWFVAGLALVGWRGLGTAENRLSWQRLTADEATVVRTRAVIQEGWTDARWGWRSRVRVPFANSDVTGGLRPGLFRIELRSASERGGLPPPGSEVDLVARPTGDFNRPLLVVSSPRLIRSTGNARGLPAFRERLARHLLKSAGTDVRRIRAAQLASALALGRRDVISPERRDRWRQSGFAHLLAVSGLHVGVVGASVWLFATVLGTGPRTARLICLTTIPVYTLLTGASPSAIRATLMFVIYLGARFLGRAVVPMGAVLLAAFLLLMGNPAMVVQPGFQLTVLVTAALVRWVPPIAAALPGPVGLSGLAAVPLVAQLAAAPVVAAHFRSLIPGAMPANVVAMPLLPPVVLLSLAAAFTAPIWSSGSAGLLTVVAGLTRLLDGAGAPARARELVAPEIGTPAVALFAVLGWLALQAGPKARPAAALWLTSILVINAQIVLPQGSFPPSFDALPVSDGAAILISRGRTGVLADTGRYQRQAAVLASDSGRRHLQALVISHTDEDHAGGAPYTLRTLDVERLVVPNWMLTRRETVPMLRAARRAGTRIVPVARGVAINLDEIRLKVLWPAALNPPREENERSLVATVELGPVTGLLTSDIGRTTERRLARASRLGCDVLIVPHHGSRGSCSQELLDAASPTVALVPAAADNNHGHPHPEVLDRLAARGIIIGMPSEHHPAGARWDGRRWTLYP